MAFKNRPLAIDLFSGCGGFSLGVESAGFDLIASLDNDSIHSLVHHFNFPDSVTICQDIRAITGNEILAKIAKKKDFKDIDLIIGSPPCQGFSIIGKREFNDPRNYLLFEFHRIVNEIKPKYFILENVPGLLKGKQQKYLQELIRLFESSNYNIVTPIQVLNGVNFGVSQERKRLILMGYRQDVTPCQYSIPKYGNSQSNLLLKPLITVSEVLSDLANIPCFIGEDKGIDKTQLTYSTNDFEKCHTRAKNNKVYGHLGSIHQDKIKKRFQLTPNNTKEPISHFFKLAEDGVCNTLRAGTNNSNGSFTSPRPIHYEHPRCITIREAARLHGFPDWFQFHRTIWHGFREIGNAVIPLLAKSLGEEIIRCLDININELEVKKLKKVDDSILLLNQTQAQIYYNKYLLNP